MSACLLKISNRAAGALALILTIPVVRAILTTLNAVDYAVFWTAGWLARHGLGATAYSIPALAAAHTGWRLERDAPFLNPPPFLLLLAPLSALPPTAAFGVLMLASFLAYLGLAWRLAPKVPFLAAIFPPVIWCLMVGQNGLLTGALLLGAALTLDRRPVLAGVLIGAMVIKPHLALLVPVALVAGGRWKTFAAAAAASLTLIAFAELAFPGATAAYLHQQLGGAVLDLDYLQTKLRTVFGALRLAGAPGAAAMAVQAACSLTMAVIVWRRWRGPGAAPEKFAALIAATPLASPYLFDYDLPMLILPLAFVAPARPRLAAAIYVSTALLWAPAMMWKVSLAPVVWAILLWATLTPPPRRA